MKLQSFSIDRYEFETNSDFDHVVEKLYLGIGRPGRDALAQMLAEPQFERFTELVNAAVGATGLMEFMKLDLGDALAKGPHSKAYRIIRIVAGNPLIMRSMIETVPHAGSYAPITILVYEERGKVKIAYDSLESFIRGYGSLPAIEVAKDLDRKVLALLKSAAD